ncbi:hypothetical protein [Nocardia sp. NPDC003345]
MGRLPAVLLGITTAVGGGPVRLGPAQWAELATPHAARRGIPRRPAAAPQAAPPRVNGRAPPSVIGE